MYAVSSDKASVCLSPPLSPATQLVCLDYLQRNTDRGLDNFMLRPYVDAEGHQHMALGAIDNSLAFPHKHPVGIRSYPMGWLYLPVDLIGGPFSAQTRAHFIPLLSDAAWWRETTLGLRRIFERDEHFDAKLFERQMSVMRGQGWNLLQSLRNPQEGELARLNVYMLCVCADSSLLQVHWSYVRVKSTSFIKM